MKYFNSSYKKLNSYYSNLFLVNTVISSSNNNYIDFIRIPKKSTHVEDWICSCGLPMLYRDGYYHYFVGQVLNISKKDILNQVLTIEVNVSKMNFFFCIPLQLPTVLIDLFFKYN